MTTNPKTVSWANPTQGTDQAGATVPWDASSDMAGIELQFDGTPAVSVPMGFGTSFELTTLAAYKALPAGSHNLDMAIVTKEGAVSAFSSTVPFQVAVVPLAPTAVVLG